MRIEIRLLARLVRIPLLRVEGVVAVSDTEGPAAGGGTSVGTTDLGAAGRGAPTEARASHAPPLRGGPATTTAFGRDLAAAEHIMAELDRTDQRG